jgi:Mg2+ and Co2+ transporters
MLNIYTTKNGKLNKTDKLGKDMWVNITNPTPEEINTIIKHSNIDINHLNAALDIEEYSRVEITPNYTIILIDVPLKEIRNETNAFTTIPLTILLINNCIVTISLQETELMKPFIDDINIHVDTANSIKFTYQLFLRIASLYQTYLRVIDSKRMEIEAKFKGKTKKSDLIELHELESNLVYFATSLSANSIVLEKLLMLSKSNEHSQNDVDILNNAIIEHRQAAEMTNIYRSIISGTRELLASIIDNNLNTVMKLMTSITVVMSIPAIISGFYGMNVNPDSIPLADVSGAFLLVSGITVAICISAILILMKKDML